MEARHLRFRSPPRTAVRFHGSPDRESVSRSERHHLPDPVPEGVDHEDVRVDYLLATRLNPHTAGDLPEE